MTRDELQAIIASAADGHLATGAINAILAAVDAYTHAQECWCCGIVRRVHTRTDDGPLCSSCYKRWARKGFAGPGPGPSQRPPVAESIQEHADVITSLPAHLAAERLGRSERQIQRWRRALREAS